MSLPIPSGQYPDEKKIPLCECEMQALCTIFGKLALIHVCRIDGLGDERSHLR